MEAFDQNSEHHTVVKLDEILFGTWKINVAGTLDRLATKGESLKQCPLVEGIMCLLFAKQNLNTERHCKPSLLM